MVNQAKYKLEMKRPVQFRSKIRSTNGNTLAEFGPTLLLAFTVIIFPMIGLGQIGMRYLFLQNAANLAAQTAAKSVNFLANTTATTSTGSTYTEYSAVNTASNVSQACLKQVGGGTVTWVSTNTYIYICPMGSTTLTTPGANKPLTTAANAVSNTYNCVVVVAANISPIFPNSKLMVGSIPGLNAAISTTAQASCFFENTSNLNQ